MKSEKHEKYPTDMTDSRWKLIRSLIPKPKSGPGKPGRPASDMRTVVNGIFYANKTGCRWRMLPREFGKWQTVCGFFNNWSKTGVWREVMETLARKERTRRGRKAEPSAGSADSQSLKTVTHGATEIGYDGNKKINGRKRHALVDTLGILLCVIVTAADTSDREGLMRILADYFAKGARRLRKIWVDGGCAGQRLWNWVRGLKKTHKVDLEVVEKQGQGFHVVKRRWVVERTFSWLLNFRRNTRDFEKLPRNSETMLQIAMTQILLGRLA